MNVYIYGLSGVLGIEEVYGVARSLADAQKLATRRAKRNGFSHIGEWSGGRKKGWGCSVGNGIYVPSFLSLWVIEKVMR